MLVGVLKATLKSLSRTQPVKPSRKSIHLISSSTAAGQRLKRGPFVYSPLFKMCYLPIVHKFQDKFNQNSETPLLLHDHALTMDHSRSLSTLMLPLLRKFIQFSYHHLHSLKKKNGYFYLLCRTRQVIDGESATKDSCWYIFNN